MEGQQTMGRESRLCSHEPVKLVCCTAFGRGAMDKSQAPIRTHRPEMLDEVPFVNLISNKHVDAGFNQKIIICFE